MPLPFHRLVGISVTVVNSEFIITELDPGHVDAKRWQIVTKYGEKLNCNSLEQARFVDKLLTQAYVQGKDDKVYEFKKALGLDHVR